MSDYKLLGDSVPGANRLRTGVGLVGLLVTTLGCLLLASSHSDAAGPDSRAPSSSQQPFQPTQGLQEVLAQPGAPSVLQLASGEGGVTCFFLYLPATQWPAGQQTTEDAVLYGAALYDCDGREVAGQETTDAAADSAGPSGPLVAVVTGEAGDKVEGKLVCYPRARAQDALQAADKLHAFDPNAKDKGIKRRGMVRAVRRDGSWQSAILYYQTGLLHVTEYKEDRSAFPGHMSFEERVVLVTGANKGIGFEIAKRLLEQAVKERLMVLLGARDQQRGQEALEKLRQAVPANRASIALLQLDVNSAASIEKAAKEVESKYGKLDILINNAGWAAKGSAFNAEIAQTTLRTNYYGVMLTSQAFLPLLRRAKNGRIVNVSSMSGAGALRRMAKPLQQEFLAADLTVEGLSALVERFVADVRAEQSDQRGWPHNTYGVSKAAVSMLTRIMARDEQRWFKHQQQQQQQKGQDTQTGQLAGHVLINACCPGWCRTDMAGPSAPLSSAQGAVTPVLLALLPATSAVTGTFWQNGKQSPSFLS